MEVTSEIWGIHRAIGLKRNLKIFVGHRFNPRLSAIATLLRRDLLNAKSKAITMTAAEMRPVISITVCRLRFVSCPLQLLTFMPKKEVKNESGNFDYY